MEGRPMARRSKREYLQSIDEGRHGIVAAVRAIEAQLPFALRGLDSDNGSEFINDHLWAFCQRPRTVDPVHALAAL